MNDHARKGSIAKAGIVGYGLRDSATLLVWGDALLLPNGVRDTRSKCDWRNGLNRQKNHYSTNIHFPLHD